MHLTQTLQKRIVITLGLVAAARSLDFIYVPASFSLFPWMRHEQISMRFMNLATVGGFGLAPYVIGSILVTLSYYVTRRGEIFRANKSAIASHSVRLGGVLAAIMAVVTSSFALKISGLTRPPVVWVVGSTVAGQVAGFFLLVFLARLISRHGLGNGVVWILLIDAVAPVVHRAPQILTLTFGEAGTPEDRFARILLFLMAAGAVATLGALLLRAQRGWRVEAPAGSIALFALPLIGVGIVGLSVGWSLAGLPLIWARIAGATEQIDENSTLLFLKTLLAVALSIAATIFFAAWAFRSDGLRKGTPAIARENAGVYDRKLLEFTLPVAVGLSLFGAAQFLLARRWAAFALLDPFVILPLFCVGLTTFGQARAHMEMATHYEPVTDEPIAGDHGESHDANLDDPEPPVEAADDPQDSQSPEESDQFDEDEYPEIIDGWATDLVAESHSEAQARREQLTNAGFKAVILSNTIEPMYGTTGLFAINGYIPFLAFRELGGGAIRVMVPMEQWTAAGEISAEPMIPAGSGDERSS